MKPFAALFIACLLTCATRAQTTQMVVGQSQNMLFTDLAPDVNYWCDWVYPNHSCWTLFGFDVNHDGIKDFDISHSYVECMFSSYRVWNLQPRSNVEFVADSLGITPYHAGDTIGVTPPPVPDFKVDYGYDSLGMPQWDTTYFVRQAHWVDSSNGQYQSRLISYIGGGSNCPGRLNWNSNQSDTNYFAFRVIQNTDTAYGWAKLYFNDSYIWAGESFAITGDTGSFAYTGIEPEDKTEPETKLYPNPVSNVLFIETPYRSLEWQIFTPKGEIIKQAKTETESIDVSQLRAGFYFLRLSNRDYSLTKRFIKE